MEPLILDQLWFRKQVSHRDHQRSHWLVPCTRQLGEERRRWFWHWGQALNSTCSVVTQTAQLPSLWASPAWGRGPGSRTPHSTEEIWSDRTPSNRKRNEREFISKKGCSLVKTVFWPAQKKKLHVLLSCPWFYLIPPLWGTKVKLFHILKTAAFLLWRHFIVISWNKSTNSEVTPKIMKH